MTKKIKLKVVMDDKGQKMLGCYSAWGATPASGIRVHAASPDEYGEEYCSNFGQVRFHAERNTLQVCGNDYRWYESYLSCIPGTKKTCESNPKIFMVCDKDGEWDGFSEDSCEEWD